MRKVPGNLCLERNVLVNEMNGIKTYSIRWFEKVIFLNRRTNTYPFRAKCTFLFSTSSMKELESNVPSFVL